MKTLIVFLALIFIPANLNAVSNEQIEEQFKFVVDRIEHLRNIEIAAMSYLSVLDKDIPVYQKLTKEQYKKEVQYRLSKLREAVKELP